MKPGLYLCLVFTVWTSAQADDIIFTNRTATFTNLQGHSYECVQLIRGDQDGLIWRDGASGGRVCYTNLHPDLLESFGISSNRIEIAKARADQKAAANARYRANVLAQAQAKLSIKPGATNAVPAPPGLDTPPADSDSQASVTYSPYPAYAAFPYGFPYGVYPVVGPTAEPAPRAASAPRAAAAPAAGSAPKSGSVPRAAPALKAPPALSAPHAPPAVLSPSLSNGR